jgi:hypothetical protein
LAAERGAEEPQAPVSTIVLGAALGALALLLGGAACVRALSPGQRDSTASTSDAEAPRVKPWRLDAPPSLFSSALLPYDASDAWAKSRTVRAFDKPTKAMRF